MARGVADRPTAMEQSFIPDVTGVILAGGQSRRMGRDKRLIEFQGERLLRRVQRRMQCLFAEVLLVVAEPCSATELLECMETELVGCRTVVDALPGCGSLGGLYTGLQMARGRRVFAVACDMPFLDAALIRQICSYPDDIVMARVQGRLHPLHAVYSKRCLGALRAMLDRRVLSIQRLRDAPSLSSRVLSEEEVRTADPALSSFLNVNTPQDLDLAGRLAGLLSAPQSCRT